MTLLLALTILAQEAEERSAEIRYADRALRYRSADGSLEGYFLGTLRINGRLVFDRPDDETAPLRSVPDGLLVRQGRLEAGGAYHREWSFRIQFDVATGTTNQSSGAAASGVSNAVRDAWLEWRRFPELSVRIGQFFSPFFAEEILGSRYIEFQDRSPASRLSIGREIGIMAYGKVDPVGYSLMLSQGGALVSDQGRSVPDANDEKELIAAVHVRPLPGIRLGAGASHADVDDVDADGFDLVSTGVSALYLDSTAGTFDGARRRFSAHLIAHSGPASVRGEILLRRDDLASPAPEDEIESLGWYAVATWLVTGEDKVVLDRPAPASDWGALEVAFRVGRVEVRNAFETLLASPAGNAERITSASLSLTWWYGNHVRVSLEVVREEFSDPLSFDNRREDSLAGLLGRLQFDF